MAEHKQKAALKPERSIVSLEFSDRQIKLCEAAFFKRNTPVFRFITRKLPSESTDISGILADLFAAYNLTSKKVFLNIPRHLVMARIYHLPSVNEEEIKSMVKMEAIKHLPYKDSDIITGFRVIERFRNGYSDVLLAIIQAETINRLVRILQGAGLSVEKIALGSESLLAWHSAVLRKVRKAESIALVNIDSAYVNIDILYRSRLVFSRAFSYEPDFSQSSELMDKLSEEIRKTIAVYQKERNLKINRIFVSGAQGKVKALGGLLKEELSVLTEFIAQTEGVELAENAEEILNENSFIELIGLSLRLEDIKINLLPEGIKETREFFVFKKAVTKTLILLSCVGMSVLAIMGQKLFSKSRTLYLLNSEIKAIAPQVNAAKKMREDLKIVKAELQQEPLAIDILCEIYKITTGGITFSLLEYENDKTLLLRGTAPSLDAIIRFISRLENAQYLENVKLKYTAKRRRRGTEMTGFEIVCLLAKG